MLFSYKGDCMFKDDKDFKFLLLIMILLSANILISVYMKGCEVEQPHPIYDSIYMSKGNECLQIEKESCYSN